MTCECLHPCLREAAAEFPDSPGPVAEDELICRAVFDPMHKNKSGQLRNSVIKRKELAAGELSVWRLPKGDHGAAVALASKLQAFAPAGNAVDQLLAVPAAVVRGIHADGLRMFSVLDDTRIDDADGTDPQHAAISPCQRLLPHCADPDNQGALEDMINQLMIVLRESRVWSSAGQAGPVVS